MSAGTGSRIQLGFLTSSNIAAFGREFAKPQRVYPDFHRFLIEAQELGTTSDYGQLNSVTTDQATEQNACTKQFLALAIKEIGSL